MLSRQLPPVPSGNRGPQRTGPAPAGGSFAVGTGLAPPKFGKRAQPQIVGSDGPHRGPDIGQAAPLLRRSPVIRSRIVLAYLDNLTTSRVPAGTRACAGGFCSTTNPLPTTLSSRPSFWQCWATLRAAQPVKFGTSFKLASSTRIVPPIAAASGSRSGDACAGPPGAYDAG